MLSDDLRDGEYVVAVGVAERGIVLRVGTAPAAAASDAAAGGRLVLVELEPASSMVRMGMVVVMMQEL